MKKRPVIPRLDGGTQTILLVEDVERSVEFYRDSLRLEMTDGDADRYAEFDTGDGVLLLVKREGTIAPMAGAMAGGKGSALTFSVSSDGYAVWKQWLEKRGVPIDRETRWIHGGRSLYVLDPDGRRLEFKTPPVIAPPPNPPAAEKKT
ncbi:MAG: VOC family protein [Verrucomicrobia bacterium]|nr:VOC family protein [Verrucomicrobiota bacterium]